MRRIADLSIRTKLVGMMLIATLLSLVVGVAFVLLVNRRSYEQELIRSVGLTAQLQADYSAIALAFDEPGLDHLDRLVTPVAVDESAIAVDESVQSLVSDAVLFDTAGKVFASAGRSGQAGVPETVHRNHHEIRDGYLHYFHPVMEEDVEVGTLYLRVDTSGVNARIADHVRTLMSLMGVAFLASLALAYALHGPISRPIQALAAVVGRVTCEGDYSVRVSKTGEDEIGQLYDGFNAMMAQIEQRQIELERSNRDLNQFAHIASHDLKAPLRAIASLSAWLDEDHGAELSTEGRQKLSSIRDRVSRMDELIQGILQYARVGRGGSRRRPVDVGGLLRDVIDLIDVPEGCVIEIKEPMPSVVSQRLGLEQIFANLITNALRHHNAPSQAHVTISAERLATGFAFTVADDGPGIGAQDQGKIFHMFLTLEDSTGGTGIGLSLVKKLVEDEGGKIQVVSIPGEGSVFRFSWPQSASDNDTVTETLAAMG